MAKVVAILLLLACGSSYAQTTITSPVCLPGLKGPMSWHTETIPQGVSTRYTMSAVWVCTTPGGYITMVNLFNPTQDVLDVVWSYIQGTWTLAQAQADCKITCVPNTPAETTYSLSIAKQYYPVATVMANGPYTTRNVYTTLANGKLNPTVLPGESAIVGSRCNEGQRIPTAPQYFSVAGTKDQNGLPLPANAYAVCQVSFPLSPN